LVEHLFTSLTRAVEGSAHIALTAALVWGVLSVILSPCHLSSIPLIVGFISEQGKMTTRRAFSLSLLFGLGILSTIALIGVVTAAMGRMIGDVGRYGNYAVGVIFFVVGLHLIGLVPMPLSGASGSGFTRKGLAAAFVLGLVFGIALGPCTFAYMAPILAISFKAAAASMIYGVALLAFYGFGHCSVIVAAGTSAEAVQRYLNWNEKSRATGVVKAICGVLVILGGVYLILVAA
jgi:cytochrome c-type biogenesis protein